MRLEAVGLFQGITAASLQRVSALGKEESHAPGVFLFQRGDPARSLYVLEAGRVRLKIGETGHVALLHCNPGDVVGWTSLTGHESHFASAECIDAVTVLKFEAAALAGLLEQDPASGLHFYRALSALIGGRLIASYTATVGVHGERLHKHWG